MTDTEASGESGWRPSQDGGREHDKHGCFEPKFEGVRFKGFFNPEKGYLHDHRSANEVPSEDSDSIWWLFHKGAWWHHRGHAPFVNEYDERDGEFGDFKGYMSVKDGYTHEQDYKPPNDHPMWWPFHENVFHHHEHGSFVPAFDEKGRFHGFLDVNQNPMHRLKEAPNPGDPRWWHFDGESWHHHNHGTFEPVFLDDNEERFLGFENMETSVFLHDQDGAPPQNDGRWWHFDGVQWWHHRYGAFTPIFRRDDRQFMGFHHPKLGLLHEGPAPPAADHPDLWHFSEGFWHHHEQQGPFRPEFDEKNRFIGYKHPTKGLLHDQRSSPSRNHRGWWHSTGRASHHHHYGGPWHSAGDGTLFNPNTGEMRDSDSFRLVGEHGRLFESSGSEGDKDQHSRQPSEASGEDPHDESGISKQMHKMTVREGKQVAESSESGARAKRSRDSPEQSPESSTRTRRRKDPLDSFLHAVRRQLTDPKRLLVEPHEYLEDLTVTEAMNSDSSDDEKPVVKENIRRIPISRIVRRAQELEQDLDIDFKDKDVREEFKDGIKAADAQFRACHDDQGAIDFGEDEE